MKRRKFLQAATALPFFNTAVLAQRSSENDTFGRQNGFRQFTGINKRDFFYKPADAWAADFIPLYDNGEFQLFYLLDWRDKEKHGEGTPWYRISTSDFVNFSEHGEML